MRFKRVIAGISGLMLMLALAGCGTAAPAASTGPAATSAAPANTPASAATATTQAEAAQPVQALKGEATIYTSQPEADIQALLEAFNKKQPDIKINVFRSGTEEVISKILAEKQANSILADLLLVADSATFESLKAQDLLMSYKSPELEGISSDYYDADNTYAGTKVISTGIIVNTDLIKKEITALTDLTSPDLKDQLIMPSPLYSGAAAYNLGVITRTGGLGWEFYESLKANGVKVDQGNGAIQKAVVGGQKGLGIIVDYMALRSKAEGAPVEFIYPREGSLSVTEPIGIIKGTKKEDLAKAFVDFILSADGQKATAEIGYTPIKSGVEPPKGFKSIDEIKNLTYDLGELVKTRNDDKDKFSKMFQ